MPGRVTLRTLIAQAAKKGKVDLATRIKAFQFQEIWLKAASEMASLVDASSLLGHTDTQITKRVCRRASESVKLTK